jgi:hypothetical protein
MRPPRPEQQRRLLLLAAGSSSPSSSSSAGALTVAGHSVVAIHDWTFLLGPVSASA